MAEQNFAPYAPAKAVLGVIQKYRDRGLPAPLTPGVLEQVGVPASMAARTLQALRFLGLIDEGGNRLPSFDNLQRAKTDEYPGQLAEIIRAAYLPVFTIVDPAVDSDTAIADAFRGYEPRAQRDKMIALFRGLCMEASIMGPRPRAVGGAPKRQVGGALSARSRTSSPKRTEARRADVDEPRGDDGAIDTRVLTALIQQLPKERRWTTVRRQRWFAMFESAVDFVVEVDDAPPAPKEATADAPADA